MPETIQFDPKLKELLLRRTGDPLGAIPIESVPDEVIPVIVRLANPRVSVEGLTIITQSGSIVSGRIQLSRIVEVRQDPNVLSLKLSQTYGPMLSVSIPEIHAAPLVLHTAVPRGVSGRGVIVAALDWGFDFVHANFRDATGRTRALAFWDQRGGPLPDSPVPFGYGREFSREQIDAALAYPDPYKVLGYDPADADPFRNGTHCTHVLDIAAGNGLAPGSAPGVAPEADLIVVHLKGNDTQPEDTLGDSVRVLEGIHYVLDRAGDRPVVINLSLGSTGGPHDWSPLVVQAMDALLSERDGCAIVMSTGNYYDARLHSSGNITAGEHIDLSWEVLPLNDEIAELEVWYRHDDVLVVELIDPAGRSLASVKLGEDQIVRDGQQIVASIYHRRHDPNNGDNQINVFLWPDALVGTWLVRLVGAEVSDGTYHAWIERGLPTTQSRFTIESATPTHTIGSICNGRNTIAVGAYDARLIVPSIVPFSSAGPSRDGRLKPDISAPGAGIRAARSSLPSPNGRQMHALTIKSGTSMAAPHVTGTCALMFEAAGNRRLSAAETREILFATARSVPPSTELERLRYGAGRVDAAAAVRAVHAKFQPAGMEEVPMADEAIDADPWSSPQTPADNTQTIQQPLEIAEDGAGVPLSDCGEIEPFHIETAGAMPDEEHIFGRNDAQIKRRLDTSLPYLLVEYGDRALQKADTDGRLTYDPRQPLHFKPTERRYTLTDGKYNYHAANFVFNTAYELGYDVPVYPLGRRHPAEGRAYNSTAVTFDALSKRDGERGEYFNRFFAVVALPGESAPPGLREGDLLLCGPEIGRSYGHIAIIVDPFLRPMGDPFWKMCDGQDGSGVHCIDTGLVIHTRDDRIGYQLLDRDGTVLPTRMVIRLRESVIDLPRVLDRLASDGEYRDLLLRKSQIHNNEQQYPRTDGQAPEAALTTTSGIYLAESNPDPLVAVPGFSASQRTNIVIPLLNSQQSAAAAAWNATQHPARSGLWASAIATELMHYVDFAAVSSAITAYNAGNPSVPIAAGSAPWDAVMVEALHQFQVKCFADASQHDGKAGESTLDTLGLVERNALNNVDQPNTVAQVRLRERATQVAQDTADVSTAATWFQQMVNPSFLGRRFTNGIHLQFARQLIPIRVLSYTTRPYISRCLWSFDGPDYSGGCALVR